MRRFAPAVLAAAALAALPASAAAKLLTTLQVCGAAGCVDRTDRLAGADRGHGGLMDIGDVVAAPDPAPFVRLKLGIGDGRQQVFAHDTMLFVPGSGVVWTQAGGWREISAASRAAFRRLAGGVTPLPAARLVPGTGAAEPPARVSETFQPGAAVPDDGGSPAPVVALVLGGVVAAAAAVGGLAWRRRRHGAGGATARRPAPG